MRRSQCAFAADSCPLAGSSTGFIFCMDATQSRSRESSSARRAANLRRSAASWTNGNRLSAKWRANKKQEGGCMSLGVPRVLDRRFFLGVTVLLLCLVQISSAQLINTDHVLFGYPRGADGALPRSMPAAGSTGAIVTGGLPTQELPEAPLRALRSGRGEVKFDDPPVRSTTMILWWGKGTAGEG
jgi:hypothetical protein